MSALEEFRKIFGKEIEKINKKIKDLNEKYEYIKNSNSLLVNNIHVILSRLSKLEKLNNIHDIEKNKNIDNNNDNEEGKLFRSQISTRSKTKKIDKNNEDFLVGNAINYSKEKKENKKKKKSQSKSKKKVNTNQNSIFINYINNDNNNNNNINIDNENYMDNDKNDNIINKEIVENNNDNFNSIIINDNYNNMSDIVSFGKKNYNNNNLNNSVLTTSSANFSEFSFNPEKLLRNNIIKKGNQPKILENTFIIDLNKKQNNQNDKLYNYNFKINNNIKFENIIKKSEIIKDMKELKLIITSLPNFDGLNLYCPTFQIIFQSPSEGDSVKNFHKICDSEPNIIVLVESSNNNRFGGYTSIGFSSDGEKKNDDWAFLFSFDEKRIYKIKKQYQYILCDPDIGPCFGDKNNKIFSISDNFLKEKSYFNKSKEFYIDKDLDDSKSKKQEFIIKKLEIFKVLI